MLVENPVAANHAGGVPCAREVEYLCRRAFRITWDTSRACLKHAEITHAPLGCIAADQHDAVAVLDALASEKSGHACRKFAQVRIHVLFFAPVALDAHC